MNIFVLEDDLNERMRLIRLIKEAVASTTVEVKKLLDTGKPQEIIENIKNNRSSQMLYFLDIEIKDDELKGLDVAKAIRALDRFATIVFITTHSEFSLLTYSYQVSALQFLAKDQEDGKLKQEILECLVYVQKSLEAEVPRDVFRFENEHTIIEVPYAKILYFETLSQPHKLALITIDQRIEFYSKLSEIEKKDNRLYRCHKSVVVNIENVIDIDRTLSQIKMVGGATCYLSRRKIKELQKRRLAIKT